MLINCPECNKEISDKATVCPNCGYPIAEQNQNNMQNEELQFPEDMSLGKSLVATDFLSCSAYGYYDKSINNIQNFTDGQTVIALFESGIKIVNNKKELDIHKSQLISLEEITKQEIATKDKSIIGRAIVGGILFSGVGALVGAISGIGKKETTINNYFLVINYWDIDTKDKNSIILSDNASKADFINKYNQVIQGI